MLIDKKTKFCKPLLFSVIILFLVLCIILQKSPDHLIGAAFCHQLTARSPDYGFPFCYRCSGLYFGIVWGMLFSVFCQQKEKLYQLPVIIGFLIALLIYLLDIINKTDFIPVHWYDDRPEWRLITSFPLGFMLVQVMASLFFYFFPFRHSGQVLSDRVLILFLLIGEAIAYPVIFSKSYALLKITGYLLAGGSLVFLTSLYSILLQCVCILIDRTYQKQHILIAASFISVLQICLFGGFHIAFFDFQAFSSYTMIPSGGYTIFSI